MIYLNSDFNEMFDKIFGTTQTPHWKTTLVTKSEDSENYEINHTNDGAYLFFEAPGFNKSTLKVEMENGILYIDGKRTYKLNGEEKVRKIKKEFRIGDDYNTSSIEATIEDGLLTVFVPNYKKQEKTRISLL